MYLLHLSSPDISQASVLCTQIKKQVRAIIGKEVIILQVAMDRTRVNQLEKKRFYPSV